MWQLNLKIFKMHLDYYCIHPYVEMDRQPIWSISGWYFNMERLRFGSHFGNPTGVHAVNILPCLPSFHHVHAFHIFLYLFFTIVFVIVSSPWNNKWNEMKIRLISAKINGQITYSIWIHNYTGNKPSWRVTVITLVWYYWCTPLNIDQIHLTSSLS